MRGLPNSKRSESGGLVLVDKLLAPAGLLSFTLECERISLTELKRLAEEADLVQHTIGSRAAANFLGLRGQPAAYRNVRVKEGTVYYALLEECGTFPTAVRVVVKGGKKGERKCEFD